MRPITVFIHVALLHRANERVNQFVECIQQSGLMEKVKTIYVWMVGDDTHEIPICRHPKLVINHASSNVEEYELPTLARLFEHCVAHPDERILYLHTKGVGKEVNPCIEDWVQYMLYFLVEKHKDVILKLDTHTTVGVDLRQEPVLHYSGNFWWANASFITTLPHPIEFNCLITYPNPLQSLRHNQEFWICHNTDDHYSLWDCGINCYERHVHRYSREMYDSGPT